MLRFRDAKYCNLKLFLIYLVVFGHWLEPHIENENALMQLYRFIYAFHMPLFVFLSGLFLRNQDDCLRQCKRSLKIYLPIQALTVILGLTSFFTPYWHLWYLFSYAIWCAAAYKWFFFRKYGSIVLVFLTLIACVAGYVPLIGRAFSLSRTIVFFPYFWAGMLMRTQTRWNRVLGIFALLLAFVALYTCPFPYKFYYQADAYRDIEYGFIKRLVCYAVGGALCLFFLAFAPSRRFPFTKLGADTMPAYLLHAPVVLLCRKFPIPLWMGPVLCAVLLYLIFKLLQWHRTLYGICEGGRKWQHFKRSMNNMQRQSTDSCSL